MTTPKVEGVIIRIDNHEEPALIWIRLKDGNIVTYSIDNIKIISKPNSSNKIIFEPFVRDKK